VAAIVLFIHLLCGVTFFGIFIASFVYIAKSIKQNNHALLQYAIKTSLLGDCAIFPMILIQILTGTFLVHHNHLPLNTPWIIVAYSVFALAGVLWFLLGIIKYMNISSKPSSTFRFKKIFYILNCVMIVIFCMIIHDAVTQQTWLFYGSSY
jgi:uncharacterized membrane protein